MEWVWLVELMGRKVDGMGVACRTYGEKSHA